VLLVDVDGVLVRSHFSDILRERYGITSEQTRAFFTGPFHECNLGRGDLVECVAPYLPEWGWTDSVEAFLDLWFTVATVVERDVVEAIRTYRAAGFVCWLATDQEQRRMERLLLGLGLGREVDGCFCSADIGAVKAAPAFWRHVLERLKRPGESLLLVDDLAHNIEVARASGLHAELYRELPDLHAAVAKHFGAS
jgi:putative hydrolase of the HAD superfamily